MFNSKHIYRVKSEKFAVLMLMLSQVRVFLPFIPDYMTIYFNNPTLLFFIFTHIIEVNIMFGFTL